MLPNSSDNVSVTSSVTNDGPPSASVECALVVPVWRSVYIGCGGFFLALGALGAWLPVLPTTPFLLLASYFFVRSWPRLNERILSMPVFGTHVRAWNEQRGVRVETKWVATFACVGTGGFSLWAAQATWGLQVLMVVLLAVGLLVVWSLKTVR